MIYYTHMLIAVDTGGTKTLITGFSHTGKTSVSYKFPTPVDEDEYIASVIEAIHDNFRGRTIDAIVIAVPGMVRNNKAVWCGNLGWKNFDIAPLIKNAFRCPVWLENDANLAGLGEIRMMKKPPVGALYVTISTGIGTGIITEGNINPGLAHSEGGHIKIEYDGCLREWENFASGAAIKQTYGKYARDITSRSVWRQVADKISRGLLTIIPVLQPEMVVIGGSIGTYYDRYEETLQKLIREHLPNHIDMPVFRQAAHPEEAVVYGCYYYGKDRLAR